MAASGLVLSGQLFCIPPIAQQFRPLEWHIEDMQSDDGGFQGVRPRGSRIQHHQGLGQVDPIPVSKPPSATAQHPSHFLNGQVMSASHDAGTGSRAAAAAAAHGRMSPPADHLVEVGPFGALEHHERLGPAPSGAVAHAPGGTAPITAPQRSVVTHKTRALAAAAGSLRSGAVGSNLRLAAFMQRSNSSGLADTLMSEHARAEDGLLTAGLPRSDSLPELSSGPSAADLAELMSMRDLDFLASMPTSGVVPSLSLLLTELPQVHAADAAAARQASAEAAAAAAAASGAAAAAAAPAAWTGGRVMSRPPSYAANNAAALMGCGSQQGLSHRPTLGQPVGLRPPAVSGWQPGAAAGLQLPALLHPQQAGIMPGTPACVPQQQQQQLQPPAQAYAHAPVAADPSVNPFGVSAALAAAMAAASGAAAAGEALGFEGFCVPPAGPHAPLGMMMQDDTFELLMQQVDQELSAEAEVKQYSALEFGTIDVPLQPPQAGLPAAAASAAGAPSGSPFIDSTAAMAAVPAVLRAAAEGPKHTSVFEGLSGGHLFEGAAMLMPAGVSAASSHTTATGLSATGPSFSNWVQQQQQQQQAAAAACSGNPAGDMAALAAAALALAAGSGSGADAGGVSNKPTSPFSLPIVPPGARGAAAPSGAEGELLGKQEVARYSRLITCKTYLKRLNITQPMAEHLLPLHDLSLPPGAKAAMGGKGTPRSSKSGGADPDLDGDGSGKGGSCYEQLFKDQITLVDEAGSTFHVQYEGVCCNLQKHLRLTCGWRDFIRAHGVEVGDTIVFERRGDERSVIYVTVVKAGTQPAFEDDERQTKKRRVNRKAAVQCLS